MAPSSLQIPIDDQPGSSSNSNSRHASASVHSQATSPPRKQRASHSVVSSTPASGDHANNLSSSGGGSNGSTTYQDVYSHPAAVAYAAAHPRRTIPKFGPYLLLQTLGEGEFGKVKLGLHSQWGEEVAVKLIRRGNVDSTVRMSKVEREIEVLRTLKHPNIVRLYDVIETDKYIGIILEYASGGELFDHILAHRYLKEKDASKLFAQLISGVWYIHQKKIVHRDLKLENLLLDRNRNVIITDFGFANRFEHRSDDLMQTSCGSPCYAAPELVISEGLYVGSAVDIWSCGVILYAMLAGYLPFDDDPANPDGDNINLLYKYIVNTPLSFPEYISEEARDLLSMMLVPDPKRRADLSGVMRHPWLAAHTDSAMNNLLEGMGGSGATAFGKGVDELEKLAMEQHQLKRLAYQRQMKAAAAIAVAPNTALPVSRTQSQRVEPFSSPAVAISASSRSRSAKPEYLYETGGADTPSYAMTSPAMSNAPVSARPAAAAVFAAPDDDDPFGPPPSSAAPPPVSSEKRKGGAGARHTIQVEYDEPSRSPSAKRVRTSSTTQQQQQPSQIPVAVGSNGEPRKRRPSQANSVNNTPTQQHRERVPSNAGAGIGASPGREHREQRDRDRTPSKPARSNSISTSHQSAAAAPVVQQAQPSATDSPPPQPPQKTEGSSPESGSQKKHRKGKPSITDTFAIGKIFGNGEANGTSSPVRVPSESQSSTHSRKEQSSSSRTPSRSFMLPGSSEKEKDAKEESKKSGGRRNTLTVMVEPFSFSRSIKNRGKGSRTPSATSEKQLEKEQRSAAASKTSGAQTPLTTSLASSSGIDESLRSTDASLSSRPDIIDSADPSAGMQASTSKARKVMAWFRTRGKGKDGVSSADPDSGAIMQQQQQFEYDNQQRQQQPDRATTPTQAEYTGRYADNEPATPTSALSRVQVIVTTPTSTQNAPPSSASRVPRSASAKYPNAGTSFSAMSPPAATPSSSLSRRFRESITIGGGGSSKQQQQQTPYSMLRIHRGAVDHTMVTNKSPPDVMKHVRAVLESMGLELQIESEYKYRCIRTKRAVPSSTDVEGVAAFTMVGSAASNGIDKRGLPAPSSSSFHGGMLRGLLMRRQSSQVATTASALSPQAASGTYDDDVGNSSTFISEPASIHDTLYGDSTTGDLCDEVRFSIELTRLARLNDTLSLDIRRIKGNLRSYKFLYDTLRDRAALSRL